MRKISLAEINMFIVNHIFHWRFWIASLTKKSKIFNKIIDKTLFDKDEIVVIPNVINVNKKITAEKSQFLPSDVIKKVIEKSEDIVIMNTCLCRSSNDCKDYPKDIGCIFLGPTTKKIPRNICYEASVSEAIEHVNQADAAGLSHIIGRNKIDTIWMNVRPGSGLLTICHCCPCCCLWKVHPNLNTQISDKLEKLEGVDVKLHSQNCVKCLKCIDVCMFKAIELKNGKITIDKNTCKCCGLCSNACKVNGISVEYNDNTIDNVINRINNLIEV